MATTNSTGLHGSCISPCIEESTHGCAGLELLLFMSSIGNAALNKAPAPNRRPPLPLGGLGEFGYHVCAPPAFPAAVGEASLDRHLKENICQSLPSTVSPTASIRIEGAASISLPTSN